MYIFLVEAIPLLTGIILAIVAYNSKKSWSDYLMIGSLLTLIICNTYNFSKNQNIIYILSDIIIFAWIFYFAYCNKEKIA